jgi:hypothetical protein
MKKRNALSFMACIMTIAALLIGQMIGFQPDQVANAAVNTRKIINTSVTVNTTPTPVPADTTTPAPTVVPENDLSGYIYDSVKYYDGLYYDEGKSKHSKDASDTPWILTKRGQRHRCSELSDYFDIDVDFIPLLIHEYYYFNNLTFDINTYDLDNEIDGIDTWLGEIGDYLGETDPYTIFDLINYYDDFIRDVFNKNVVVEFKKRIL